MTLLLIILLILLFAGGGWGYSTGHVTWGNPAGIILFVVLIVVLLGLFGTWHRPIW